MSESLINRTQYFDNKNLSMLVRALVYQVSRLGDDHHQTGNTWLDANGVWHSSITSKSSLPRCPCAYEGFCGCTCKGHECHRGLPNEASCGI